MTLRLRMVLLLLAILLPAFGGFAWIMARNVRHAQEEFRAQVLNRAHAIRVSMDQELERRETVISLLLNSPQLQKWDLAGFCALARSAVTPDTGLIVLGRGGRIILGTTNPDCVPAASGRGRMPDPITSGRVHLSDLFTNFRGEQRMAIFGTFVRDGSIYELSVGIAPEDFQERLELNRFDPGWTVAVMNPIGRVLARLPDAQAWTGKIGTRFAADVKQAEEFWRHRVGPEEGSLTGRAADGTLTHVVFSRSDRYGLTVFVTYPQSVAESSAHSTLFEESLIAAALMFFGLVLAAWAGSRVAAPADALKLAAEDLKAGRPVALSRYGVPEFDSVASSMEEASATIRSHDEELQHRVEAAVAEVQATQARLMQAQKLEIIGRLTGGIAHDFNNLLQTLSTGLAVLGQMVVEPKARPLVEAGLRAVERASRLVQQMLALGRHAPFDRQPVDLHVQLLGMEVLLSRMLVGNVRLRIDLAPGLWQVLTESTQLEVALLNLIFNARDAMPQGGLITLSAENAVKDGREGVLIKVVDEGEGMAPELLARVFEPFVTTKPVGRGTGLGLPQVHDFAVASLGSVAIDSTLGVGTTVSLWLPRAVGGPVETPAAAVSGASHSGRLLFVEDDRLIAEVVSSALRDAGFQVQWCTSADEALQRLRAGETCDVVFSDVVTGGSLNGYELVEVLRREFPQIPVVLATGFADSLQGPPPSCVVLAKPYSLQRLIESLDVAVRAAATPG